MNPSILQVCAFILSAAAFLMSVATFVRNGKWKDSEEGQKLVARIERAEKWSDTDTAREMIDKINEHESRLAAGEERFRNLATKADIERVQAEVRGLEKSVDKVDAGVIRIEKILMDRNP